VVFDDVTGRSGLSCPRVGGEVDQRFTGRDPDPQLDPFLRCELAHRERRPDCALGIVLVRYRRAEERHHGVADELLDGAAEALELRLDPCVTRRLHQLHVLRIELLGTRREAHDIGEEDRDDLPLPPRTLGHGEESTEG
jgi:hypothetical protein